MDPESNSEVLKRLERIETTLTLLTQQRTIKEWYGTDEVAKILGKSEYTVREWCRLHRINASKKGSGRGKHQGWAIAHQELQRLQRDGILPRK